MSHLNNEQLLEHVLKIIEIYGGRRDDYSRIWGRSPDRYIERNDGGQIWIKDLLLAHTRGWIDSYLNWHSWTRDRYRGDRDYNDYDRGRDNNDWYRNRGRVDINSSVEEKRRVLWREMSRIKNDLSMKWIEYEWAWNGYNYRYDKNKYEFLYKKSTESRYTIVANNDKAYIGINNYKVELREDWENVLLTTYRYEGYRYECVFRIRRYWNRRDRDYDDYDRNQRDYRRDRDYDDYNRGRDNNDWYRNRGRVDINSSVEEKRRVLWREMSRIKNDLSMKWIEYEWAWNGYNYRYDKNKYEFLYKKSTESRYTIVANNDKAYIGINNYKVELREDWENVLLTTYRYEGYRYECVFRIRRDRYRNDRDYDNYDRNQRDYWRNRDYGV